VFEVATFQVFMMISAQKRGYDILKAADYGLSGFEDVIPLNPEEKRLLFPSVIARLIILATCSFMTLEITASPFSKSQVQFFADSSCNILKNFYQESRKVL